MKYCMQCGTRLPDGVERFCPECGADIDPHRKARASETARVTSTSRQARDSRRGSGRRGSRRGRRLALLCLAVLVVLGGIGVGVYYLAKDHNSTLAFASSTTSPPIASSTTATARPTTTTTSAPQIESATRTFKDASGYTCKVSVKVRKPIGEDSLGVARHPGAIGRTSDTQDFSLESGVDYDPDTDVLIPIEVTISNLTTGFDLTEPTIDIYCGGLTISKPGYKLTAVKALAFRWFYSDDTGLSSLQVSSSGSAIDVVNADWGQSQTVGIKWSEPLATGSMFSSYGFAVLSDYYTPAYPKGEVSLLDYICVEATPGPGWTVVDEANDTDRAVTFSGEVVYDN
jgi:hypothetical protein